MIRCPRALVLLTALLVACQREGEVLGPPPDFRPPTMPPIFPPTFPEVPFTPDPITARRELGRLLFFDKILSGDRTMACASCHVVFLQATEPVALSHGTGATGVGPTRAGGVLLGRNTPDLFLRTLVEADAFFWDGRLEIDPDTRQIVHAPHPFPFNAPLPELQALMPLVDPDEMLGTPSQPGNDLAALDASDGHVAVWDAIVARLMATRGYPEVFALAFPELPRGAHGIEHVSRAIVAFERALWERFDTPEDLGLDVSVLSGLDPVEVQAGRELFFGAARCDGCHTGVLFSDQRFHNLGVPQFGPGKDAATRLDFGRGAVTGVAADRFAFRTPPLRNVALTAPYMHDGVYATLDEVVRHHLDREGSLRAFDPSDLPPEFRGDVRSSPAELDAIAATISTEFLPTRALTDREIDQLVAYLLSLTSLEEMTLGPDSGVPQSVPSGLPVDVWPGGFHPSRFANFGF